MEEHSLATGMDIAARYLKPWEPGGGPWLFGRLYRWETLPDGRLSLTRA